MTVTFFSNFLNHHQVPFCNEMYNILGENFHFVASEAVPDERLSIGYKDYSSAFPYVVNSYADEKSFLRSQELGFTSDVVIAGSSPEIFIKKRLKENKLTFRYSERLFRYGFIRILDPRVLYNVYSTHTKYRNKNLHLLCAGAYTTRDINKIYAYPGKRWKWAYFTEVIKYDIDRIMAEKNSDTLQILWVGRFLKLKHPEYAINLAIKLKEKKYKFHLTLIGSGEVKSSLEKTVADRNLNDEITFLAPVSHEEVRKFMLKSDIFLFTSDRREGWGAVLNESMNSGCAVVASSSIGSVPYLIKNYENGLIFKDGDEADLFNKVEQLFMDRGLMVQCGKNAYETMIQLWNPALGAERFIILSLNLLEGKIIRFSEGPCSEAILY